jgi:hypothetical protein
LLADVPTLSDLAHLNPDGTFAFDESASPVDTTTASDLHAIFTNKTVNSQGVVKDLRPKAPHFETIGETDQQPIRVTPRYDPVTGELIRPLQFKDEKPAPVISMGVLIDPAKVLEENEIPLPVEAIPSHPAPPIPRARQLGYAMGDTRKQVTLTNLCIELLMPANTVVMFFVFVLYILGYYSTCALASYGVRLELNTVWPFLIANLPMWMILSHLGSVIEDTGPDAIDELPRPLRDFSPGEDFFTPLFRTLLAGALCFWPMVLACVKVDWHNPAALPLVIVLGLVGSFFFPAVFLTAVTGTTILNLRFDRLLSVIRLCGGNYFVSIVLFITAIVPTVYYIAGGVLFHPPLAGFPFDTLGRTVPMLGIMMLAVYLIHFFAWHLGLLYRQHHDQFPWLAQRHVKEPRTAV